MVGRRNLPAKARLPSAAGTVSAASSAPSRSLAELATSSRRSVVGGRPSRSGDSARPDRVTAVSPAAIAAPWSPKVCGTPRRRSWPPSVGGPSARPPARSTERSAM